LQKALEKNGRRNKKILLYFTPTMEAKKLYEKLDKDFITPELKDERIQDMWEINTYLTESFKQKEMGLVCDFTNEINQVFTAVFPSKKVMEEILQRWAKNAMLFLHHPMIWDIRQRPIFQNMDTQLLANFKKNNISIYALHVPLDNFGKYSTSATLADQLYITEKTAFGEYFGGLTGVIGTPKVKTIGELKDIFEHAVGHKVWIYTYGDTVIKNQKVAISAGGWLTEYMQTIADLWINTFVTGISSKNSHSEGAHDIAKKYGINILWWTHYSTEKFTCQKMVGYFEEQGIPTKFIDDEPIVEDM